MAEYTVGDEVNLFSVWDYVVFSLLLGASAAIGVYHACRGGKQKTTDEFLLADRQMNYFAVAASLMVTFLSAVSLLGGPGEIYANGVSYFVFELFAAPLSLGLAAHLYMPVFYNLRLTSVFEYLELRFTRGLRLACYIVYNLQMVFYLGIVLYAPSLVLNTVTGLNVWVSIMSLGLVCTFYTTLGGMKAVVWADVLQTFILFAGMLLILIQGSLRLGGFGEVWRIAGEGDRLDLFNFNLDPRVRHTFWTLTVGGTFTRLAVYGVNQAQVQRALSCPSLREAKLAYWLIFPMSLVFGIIGTGYSLAIYANYADCDPLTTKQVSSPDQLMPFFVMDAFGHLPGFPGLFVAAIFSASLSTLSSGFNSLAAVTLKDVVLVYWKTDMTEAQATLTAKLLALGYGLLCIGLSCLYAASFLSTILQAALAFTGILGGPVLGVFTLGMFFPWANWKGAYAGLLTGTVAALVPGLGAYANSAYLRFAYNPIKPLSAEGCLVAMNTTMANTTLTAILTSTTEAAAQIPERPLLADLYAISYMYYAMIALIVCLIVGLSVTMCTGPTRPEDVDSVLISPVVHTLCCCLPQRIRDRLSCGMEFDKDDAQPPNYNNPADDERYSSKTSKM